MPGQTITLRTDDGGTLGVHSYASTEADLHAEGHKRVVVVGGAFLTAAIYRPFCSLLARQLGDGWAVDIYDRRGRGDSSPQPADYSMSTEIADLALVLRHTGAKNIMGHSLGGSVALNAVQAYLGADPRRRFEADPALVPQRLCVYDPAINIDGSINTDWLPAFERAVNERRYNTALKFVQRQLDERGSFQKVPSWLMTGLIAMTRPTKFGRMVRSLLPTAVGELKAALQEVETAESFAALPASTHLMAGALSADYFQDTALRLHRAIEGSTFELSPKSVHGAIPFMHPEVLADMADYFEGKPKTTDPDEVAKAAS